MLGSAVHGSSIEIFSLISSFTMALTDLNGSSCATVLTGRMDNGGGDFSTSSGCVYMAWVNTGQQFGEHAVAPQLLLFEHWLHHHVVD